MRWKRHSVGIEFERRWQQRFQRYAEFYEDDADIAGWTSTGLEARVRRFQQVWRGDAHGRFWMDAGCGAGTYTRLLSTQGLEVVGIDYSLASIVKARQRASNSIRWAAADVARLPMRSVSVDGILCFGVTQALADAEPMVRELCRVTRPNGEVWIDALNGWCLPHLVERLARNLSGRPPHLRYESPGRLKRLMRRAGLEQLRLYWLPIVPQRYYRLQRLVEHPILEALLRLIPPFGALLSHAFILHGVRHMETRSEQDAP